MRKMILASVFALVGVATTQAGGSFGLFTCLPCKKNCNFVVRPYNAFSPVCSGTIFCDGFMPISSGYPHGGCAKLNYTDGVQVPGAPVSPPMAPRKGAWMMPQGQPNYFPVFMQGGGYQDGGYPMPFQIIPLQTIPGGEQQ